MNHDTILRIDELERLWPLMREKLQAYDKLIDNVKDVECKAVLHQKNASQNNEYLSSKIDSVNANLLDKIDKIESRLNNLSPVILNLGLNVEKQAKEIDNIKNLLMSNNTHLDSLSKTLESCASINDLDFLKAEIKIFTKKNQDYVDELAQKINSNENKCVQSFVETSKEMHKIKYDVNQSLLEEKKLHNLIDTCNSDIVAIHASNKALYEELSNDLNKMIDDKINAIPKPLIPSQDDLKTFIISQLEPVSLDSKNANLRSVNTDTKIHLLEKKLEQLKLLIDQITLGK